MSGRTDKSKPTKVVTTSGREVGNFSTRQEAEDWLVSQNIDPIFREPELAGVTVTARRPRSLAEHLAQGAENFEETFGVTPKTAAGFIPYVGEAIDAYDIKQALRNREYLEAGVLGAGLLVPNIIEKPAKALYRGVRKAIKSARDYRIGRELNKVPLSRSRTKAPVSTTISYTPSNKTVQIEKASQAPVDLAANREWNRVAIAVQNEPFIEAYNQWNRFGYPTVPRGMESDTPKLEAFVRGQLNRHNTFSRGVEVRSKDKQALEASLGRRLTNDEFLRIAATTPRINANGEAILWISPFTQLSSMYGQGRTALVRRPFKLGADRMKWFDEASFNVRHNPPERYTDTDIMAPWNTQPRLDWKGTPTGMIDIGPESELISPARMDFVDFVDGSPHMNNRTTLNSNPFFTKGENHFDPESGQWIINTYRKGGKLKCRKLKNI